MSERSRRANTNKPHEPRIEIAVGCDAKWTALSPHTPAPAGSLRASSRTPSACQQFSHCRNLHQGDNHAPARFLGYDVHGLTHNAGNLSGRSRNEAIQGRSTAIPYYYDSGVSRPCQYKKTVLYLQSGTIFACLYVFHRCEGWKRSLYSLGEHPYRSLNNRRKYLVLENPLLCATSKT